ncbi:caspase family protein [Sedimentitalea sp. JM2-8]|uniref:Caspase family protein n=1 Tax=Sedimentitalea xiamensis TaxID=3050037 RepID=A0ABT7FI69_9RHOB|nr:caspase family protein [Sedimentitalea xiamensis]
MQVFRVKLILRLWCFLLLVAAPVSAQDRLALVIGNSGYGTVSPLDNPSHDARLIAGTLEDLGFTVMLLLDGTQNDMKRSISQFGRDLRDAGPDATGLFYYAGHGVQSFGTNYLLPVDVALSNAADLDLVAVEAQSVLRQMFSARNKTNIVILDACRNNPFSDILEFNDNGLAEMQAPTGTFLAYATAPGGVALDGTEGNSPFTRSMATQMTTPGLRIEQMFKNVRVEVIEKTKGQQTPWDASSLTSDFVFAEEEPMSPEQLQELQLWKSVQASGDPVQIMLFLRGYPEGAYAQDARALLAVLMEKELTDPSAPKPVPVAKGPSEAERKMFETAQAEASIAGYESFLKAFPDGVFAEFAAGEIVALRKKNGTDPIGEGVTPAPDTALAATPPLTVQPAETVTFTSAISSELSDLSGKSIADIIKMSPLFPPVDGLPDEYWKDKSCSNCHQWTQDRLCTQANSYLSLNMQRSLDKKHPFGGALKRNLKIWAAGGCP